MNSIIDERRRLTGDPCLRGSGLIEFMVPMGSGRRRPLDLEALGAEAFGLLWAGHETTASALTWAIYHLARDDDLARAVALEADQVADYASLATEKLEELKLVGRVIEETLRLYPSGWGLARTALRPTRIGEQVVPRHTLIIVPTYTIHRSSRYWDDPDVFNPDRFLSAHPRCSCLPFPFALGPRQCLGAALADVEMRLVIAMLTQRYTISTSCSGVPKFSPSFSLRIDDGLPVTVNRRTAKLGCA